MAFQLTVTGIAGLFLDRNRVDIRRVGRKGQPHVRVVGADFKLAEKMLHLLRPRDREDVIQRFEPILQLENAFFWQQSCFGHRSYLAMKVNPARKQGVLWSTKGTTSF